MLYLTLTNLAVKHTITHGCWIDEELATVFVKPNTDSYLKTCIVDIDDEDACALALKGQLLFRVERIKHIEFTAGDVFNEKAIMHNIDAVMDWWTNVVF